MTSLGSFKLKNEISREIRTNQSFEKEDIFDPDLVPYQYNLHEGRNMSDQRRAELLEGFNELDMYNSVNKLSKTNALLKLENFVMHTFIERNNAKRLAGLKRTIAAANRRVRAFRLGLAYLQASGGSGSVSSKNRISRGVRSIAPTICGDQIGRKLGSKRLNYKGLRDVLSKIQGEVDKRVKDFEKASAKEVIDICAKKEEALLCISEIEELTKTFNLQFTSSKEDLEFLTRSTPRQKIFRLRKFVKSFIASGNSMIGTMELKINEIKKDLKLVNADIHLKKAMKTILTAIDLEVLNIKRVALEEGLETKQINLNGLKRLTGERLFILKMVKAKKEEYGRQIKALKDKNAELVETIASLKKQYLVGKQILQKDEDELNKLKTRFDMFKAPSVDAYFQITDRLDRMRAEEKILQRKIRILTMELHSAQRKTVRTVAN